VPVALADEAFYFVLQYIADGAGYFKEEGLDIEIVRASSGSRQVATVMGGSADVAPVNMAVSLPPPGRGPITVKCYPSIVESPSRNRPIGHSQYF